MDGVLDARHSDTVGLDHSSLRGEAVGAGSTRYRMRLTGRVAGRWAEAWQKLQAEETGTRRFQLDVETATVTFSCRTLDGPAEVMDSLVRLETLVGRVSRKLGGGAED